MPKLFITLRKKFVLPFKWKRSEKSLTKQTVMPTPEDILAFQKELNAKKMIFLRRNDRIQAGKIEVVEKCLDSIVRNTLKDFINLL